MVHLRTLQEVLDHVTSDQLVDWIHAHVTMPIDLLVGCVVKDIGADGTTAEPAAVRAYVEHVLAIGETCANCGGSTAPGTPDPHVCVAAPPLTRWRVSVEARKIGAIGAFFAKICEVAAADRTEAINVAMEVIRTEGFETRQPLLALPAEEADRPEWRTAGAWNTKWCR